MQARRRNNRIWIAALLAVLLLAGCGATPTPAPTAAPTPTQAPPTPTPEPTPEPTEVPPATGSDLPTPLPPPKPAPGPKTDPPGPGTNAPTRVDDSFFADAAFFGNSLMDGLRLFGGLKYGDFYANTSASVVSVSSVTNFKNSADEPCTMLDALLEKQYHKVFVLFGINELGFQLNGFIDIYSELIAELAEGEPDARIYIFSLTPITEKRDEESDLFTKARVQEFNAAVAAMAERCGCIYVDLYTAMADEDGWLPEKEASDGIHFTVEKYKEWADFLRSYHYVENDIA